MWGGGGGEGDVVPVLCRIVYVCSVSAKRSFVDNGMLIKSANPFTQWATERLVGVLLLVEDSICH